VWVSNGGYETPLFYAVTATGLGFTGPGSISVNHLFCLSWPWQYDVVAWELDLIAAFTMVLPRARQLITTSSDPGEERSEEQPTGRIAA
jgi:hypothetical protein